MVMTTWKRAQLIAALMVVGLSLWGCGDDGVGETGAGSIQAEPTAVGFSMVDVGDFDQEVLRLYNRASEESLTIFGITLQEGDDGRIDELSVVEQPSFPVELGPDEFAEVVLEYTPDPETPRNQGELVVQNSDPQHQDGLVVPVNTQSNLPEFQADPSVVRFQRMQASSGQSATQTLQITNRGDGPLRIEEEPIYSGGDDFNVEPIGREFPVELEPFSGAAAQESPEEHILEIDITYRPLGDGQDTGSLEFLTNEVEPGSGDTMSREVDITADAESACIEVDSRNRNFGQVPIGEVSAQTVTVNNCGSETLEIDTILLEEEIEDDGAFGLDLGNWDLSGDGNVDSPVELGAGQSGSFLIDFAPYEEGTRRGEVRIFSNDPLQSELVLNLTARGAEGSCPVPVGEASILGTPTQPSSAITATPLDRILLDGTNSFDDDGEVVEWDWEVISDPPGTTAQLEPASDDPQDQNPAVREVDVLTAGQYEFGLTVEDDAGFRSCDRAVVSVTVVPDEQIHIELTWTNPADPDESDGFGSDVDLHLVKMGPGTWFDQIYSIFYQNPETAGEWGTEDPSLDIDVVDGQGPENITMSNPEPCGWYAVGVHYFEEVHGTAYATVRIYINGDMVYERLHFPLESSNEFWDVARIHWNDPEGDGPEFTVSEVDGFYPGAPQGSEPEVSSGMADSGLCTAAGLY